MVHGQLHVRGRYAFNFLTTCHHSEQAFWPAGLLKGSFKAGSLGYHHIYSHPLAQPPLDAVSWKMKRLGKFKIAKQRDHFR